MALGLLLETSFFRAIATCRQLHMLGGGSVPLPCHSSNYKKYASHATHIDLHRFFSCYQIRFEILSLQVGKSEHDVHSHRCIHKLRSFLFVCMASLSM